MKRTVAVGLWLGIFALAPQANAETIALTNIRIIDGNGGAPIERGTIVLEGKKIVAAGRATDVTIPSSARRLDLPGKTALPGLADMHTHLVGGWDGDTTNLLSFPRFLKSFLFAGVTTVLDTGNVEPYVLQLRAETAAGRLLGPRIYCVGPLVDGPDPFWPSLSAALASKQRVPGLVSRLAAEHVDLIKLYAGLSDQLITAMSSEAKKYGLRTIIDVHQRNGSIDIMLEGISGWAHPPTRNFSDDAIRVAKEHDIFFITTLATYESFARRRFGNLAFLDNPLIAATNPSGELEQVRAYASRKLTPQQEEMGRLGVSRLRNSEANVLRMKNAGILFAAGTDNPYPGCFPHHALSFPVRKPCPGKPKMALYRPFSIS